MLRIKNQNLRILFFGDIVGQSGRRGVARVIPEIKADFAPDLIMANAENAAHGKGVTEKILRELKEAGIDVFTTGEHIYDKLPRAISYPPPRAAPSSDDGEEGLGEVKQEGTGGSIEVSGAAEELFAKFPTLLKPANFLAERPGEGETVVETKAGKVLVINLTGQVFFRDGSTSPWSELAKILAQHENEDLAGIVLDFHAEATSEKLALARHFDGKLSAVLGTHTHIPTADAAILPQGTAYVTDVGMNGPYNSVLGMKSEVSINRFLTGEKIPYEIAETPEVWLNYVILEIDSATRKATNIEHVHKIISL